MFTAYFSHFKTLYLSMAEDMVFSILYLQNHVCLLEVAKTHGMYKEEEKRGGRKYIRGRMDEWREPEASEVTFYSSSK